jgi:hypothetical protein
VIADEWQDNGPQDLIAVSLCIQIAIDKNQLCLLSVAYACLYHNPTVTMGYSAVVRPVGRISKFSTVEAAYGREINIKLSGNSCGGLYSSQHANCNFPQLETSVELCCVTKLHILDCPFIAPSIRCTCVMIMQFNQLLDMPHLSGV